MAAAKKTTSTTVVKKIKKIKQGDRFMPFMVILIAVLSFAVGILWQKVSNLETGSVVAGIADTAGNAAPPPQRPPTGKLSQDQASKLVEVTSSEHIRGNANAEVFIVEYSDFECPFCSRFHPTAVQAVEDNGGKVAWVYRHFPLDSIHAKARPAAEASECVAELGGNDAFWRFADYVFENQTVALSDLSGAAVAAGVNKAAFETCFSADKFADKVEEQYQSGINAGVTGTPGNFIINKNGDTWLLPGAVPIETLQATIDEALGN